jgi:hypothetical protein
MNKLELFYVADLRNAEHFQFMTEFKTAIGSYTAETLGVKDLLPPFLIALEKENLALKIEQGSAKSEAALNLDKLRDKIWKSAWLRIESAMLSPLEDEVESGNVIRRVFEVYGDIRRHPLNQESGEMSNLVDDLLKPENATHLQNIHLDKIVPELKKANDQYIQIVSDRNVEVSGRESGNTKAARLEVDPLYELIVETINASITLKTAKPETGKFVDEHNQRVKVYQATLAARETNNKKTPGKK